MSRALSLQPVRAVSCRSLFCDLTSKISLKVAKMGVTVLQQFPMTENRTGPQTIEFLTKRIVALGAVQSGQFLVDCETYMSVPQLGESYLLHHIPTFRIQPITRQIFRTM
ncbi:mediator of RNA polymerase II transcription subunit 20 isoform X1 [Vespula maculifrons]